LLPLLRFPAVFNAAAVAFADASAVAAVLVVVLLF